MRRKITLAMVMLVGGLSLAGCWHHDHPGYPGDRPYDHDHHDHGPGPG
jgi:hypothetical protein